MVRGLSWLQVLVRGGWSVGSSCYLVCGSVGSWLVALFVTWLGSLFVRWLVGFGGSLVRFVRWSFRQSGYCSFLVRFELLFARFDGCGVMVLFCAVRGCIL